MKTQITLGQALGFAITIIGACIGVYVGIISRVTVLEENADRHEMVIRENSVQIQKASDGMTEMKSDLKLIIYKVDQISESVKGKK